jgi:hypothetical protein
MKKYVLLLSLSSAIFMSCGNDANSGKNDSRKKDSIAEIDPEEPHEVRNGDNDYAFMPDTCIKSLVLGNAESWKKYYKENGGVFLPLGDMEHYAVAYFNYDSHNKQEMEVCLYENKKGDMFPYSLIVQRRGDDHAPKFRMKPIPSTDYNFVSGHGVYIGMPLEHVMSIYRNQTFMQWEKGDTVYLQFKPKPKDANYFKRYKPDAYMVMFKFKDETLRRMEYSVDPKEFEKQ